MCNDITRLPDLTIINRKLKLSAFYQEWKKLKILYEYNANVMSDFSRQLYDYTNIHAIYHIHGTFMVELKEAIEHRTKTKKITDWTETDPSQFETHRTRKKSINQRRPIVRQREWPNSIKKITTSPYVKVSTIYLISFLFPQHFEKQTKLPLISYWNTYLLRFDSDL